MKNSLLTTWTNARGWRTRRRIVIFESDDWGATRMRNLATFERLSRSGLDVDSCPYDRFDCLESRDDLNALFNLLDRHKTSQRRAPIFTLNTVLGNPDFEAIKADGYRKFTHEGLFQAYVRYNGENLRAIWEQAIAEEIIRPQFHGREHLNVRLWLADLEAGHRDTQVAFDHQYYSHTTMTSSGRQTNYLAAFWPECRCHFEEIGRIVLDGLNLFERVFGYRSRSFIACNYVLPDALEPIIAGAGVKLIQGQRGQLQPSIDGSRVSVRRSYTGERNRYGQVYSVRNVRFEPFEDVSRDWVSSALQEIRSAFFWGTPAIVCTHRVNYVGGLDIEHRDRNLRLLDSLIKKILATWPDVEFLSSDELIRMMID